MNVTRLKSIADMLYGECDEHNREIYRVMHECTGLFVDLHRPKGEEALIGAMATLGRELLDEDAEEYGKVNVRKTIILFGKLFAAFLTDEQLEQVLTKIGVRLVHVGNPE